MKKDLFERVKKFLEEDGMDLIESYSNGEIALWGFDKDRNIEVVFKINESPDEEIIKEFKEQMGDKEVEE